MTRVFVGGGTGTTGRAFVKLGVELGLDLVVHVRPQSETKHREAFPMGPPPRMFDLADDRALGDAMAGCDAVVSMIGTMRKRFATGDTYASSDVGTTQRLVDAARKLKVKRFVLMSSFGIERAPGAYAEAKRNAERVVKESGLLWTITRPSMLYGEGRGAKVFDVLGALRALPGLHDAADDMRQIPVEVVARAMAIVARDGGYDGRVLTGRHLWAIAEGAQASASAAP